MALQPTRFGVPAELYLRQRKQSPLVIRCKEKTPWIPSFTLSCPTTITRG